jgi:hypothetical protein
MKTVLLCAWSSNAQCAKKNSPQVEEGGSARSKGHQAMFEKSDDERNRMIPPSTC